MDLLRRWPGHWGRVSAGHWQEKGEQRCYLERQMVSATPQLQDWCWRTEGTPRGDTWEMWGIGDCPCQDLKLMRKPRPLVQHRPSAAGEIAANEIRHNQTGTHPSLSPRQCSTHLSLSRQCFILIAMLTRTHPLDSRQSFILIAMLTPRLSSVLHTYSNANP